MIRKNRVSEKQTKVADEPRGRRLGTRVTDELYNQLVEIAKQESRSISAQVQVILSGWVSSHWQDYKAGGESSND